MQPDWITMALPLSLGMVTLAAVTCPFGACQVNLCIHASSFRVEP